MPLRHIATLVTVTFLLTLALSGWVHGAWDFPKASSPAPCASAAPPATASVGEYLNLTIWNDTLRSIQYYLPANFTVPSRTLIQVTIENYDAGGSNVSAPYSQVCGTVNGTETVNGATVARVPSHGIAHTFTITNGSYAGFNVAIPPAVGHSPAVVTFEAYFDKAGIYRWQCEANCGETQMSLDGQMSGLVTVR